MRRVSLALMPIALVLGGCEAIQPATEVERAMKAVNVVDETNLNEVMLTVADPNEAVDYFQRSLSKDPERIDFQRGLAQSLVRAKRNSEALSAWKAVVKHKDATNDDGVDLADAFIRNGEWKEAERQLDAVPPTHETFKRY
ncbi:MAG: hypothetical protein AAF647_11235, partial [Pseudomonadota bacterium]